MTEEEELELANQATDFPLGEPPRDDVDGAARLFVQYQLEAPLDEDHVRMFWQMCADPSAVIARYRELSGK